MAKTTSDLLTNIKRRTQLPDDGGTLSDTDILAFASDELQNVIAPRLMSVHEWQYAFSYTQALSSARTYRINSRVAGNKIISVEYFDGVNYRFIAQRHPLTQNKQGSTSEDFSIYGNQIVLSDSSPTSGTLRIRAYLRPSALVSSGGQSITAVNSNTNSLTVASSAAFSASQLVDVVYESSPYEITSVAATVSSIPDGTHVILNTSDSSWASATRVIAAETSDRIQLPDELHDYLAQRTAIRCMEARGFKQDMDNHLRKLADLEAAFDRLVSPRASGEFKAIVAEDWFWVGRV